MANAPREDKPPRSPFQGFLPFFWLGLACLVGILLSDWFNAPAWAWLAGMVISLLGLILAWRLPKALVVTHHLRKLTRFDQRLPGALVAAVFFLGGWRFAAVQTVFTPHDAAYYNDRGSVQLVGTVVEPPDYRDNITNLVVQVEHLNLFGEEQQPIPPGEITGRVLVQVHPGSEWNYGYRLMVTGPLSTPPEHADFSYQVYLARRGIGGLMLNPRIDRVEFNEGRPFKALMINLHNQSYDTLQTLFPAPESDLLAGILLGRDQGLSPGLQEAFRRTGTTHIIAISGFNVAILAGLLSGVFTRLLGRKWGALIAVAGITGYAIFVGGDASITRAAIMGTVGVLGGMFGRRQNGINSLGLAVLVMAVINPHIPWDIGFQLSAAATLGLVLYAQPLEERFVQLATRKMPEEHAHKLVGPMSQFVLFTLAAQVLTLPIMIYHFGGVSWITLIANPLILPPQALLRILGGLTVLAGLVLPGLGRALSLISLPFVRYTIHMVTWLARLPGSDLILPDFHPLWLSIFYGIVFLLTLFPKQQQQSVLKRALSPQVSLLVMAGLVLFVWNHVLSAPDGHLHLTLLDGQGTVLVQSPHGQSVLIGGGPSPSALNQALGQMLPAGHRQLDVVIVGSTYREDLLGLTGAVNRYPIKQVLWGVNPDANQTTRTAYALLAEKGVPRHTMERGQTLDLGDGLLIQVLWTGERGAVLWLSWENFSALIPTGRVDEHWLNPPAPPRILYLPSRIHSQPLPIEQITPWEPAVILLPQNPANLPLDGLDPVLEMLRDYPILGTHDRGWIRVSTDGEQVWVRAEK